MKCCMFEEGVDKTTDKSLETIYLKLIQENCKNKLKTILYEISVSYLILALTQIYMF